LQHINKLGITEFSQLDLNHLRSWLANLQSRGAARSSMSRRVVSIRAFTYWGAKNGWLNSDIGQQLVAPKPQRTLPNILDIESAITTMDALATRVDEGGGIGAVRDRAIVETLYASGIRVSELCGLDIHDIDFDRNTLRVIGKGDKERIVPIGLPAVRAVKAWLESRNELVNQGSTHSARNCLRCSRCTWWQSKNGTTWFAPFRRHPFIRGRRRFKNCARNIGSFIASYNADLYPCIARSVKGCL
jgi:integrase/recombinase XerC